MIKTYCISDTHFNHENIIKYENRPFKNVEEMNRILIKNWNNVVNKHDKIFILGDFGLDSVGSLTEICQQLNGYKILILGNHDRSKNTMEGIGFNEVSKYPIIYKDKYIFSHQPIEDTGRFFNIHGHIHSKKNI